MSSCISVGSLTNNTSYNTGDTPVLDWTISTLDIGGLVKIDLYHEDSFIVNKSLKVANKGKSINEAYSRSLRVPVNPLIFI